MEFYGPWNVNQLYTWSFWIIYMWLTFINIHSVTLTFSLGVCTQEMIYGGSNEWPCNGNELWRRGATKGEKSAGSVKWADTEFSRLRRWGDTIEATTNGRQRIPLSDRFPKMFSMRRRCPSQYTSTTHLVPTWKWKNSSVRQSPTTTYYTMALIT